MPYQTVTPDLLQRFLDQLAREYRRPGRIYLVGGTGLLYQGLKTATKDIDLSTHLPLPDQNAFTRALRRLSNELQVAVEEVSPADFIPLPQGTEQRHRYLGRKGELEVFAFDPVSTALAKLARSRPGDIDDVIALIEAAQLNLATLMAAFEEVLTRVEAGQALKITSDEYSQKMMAFLFRAQQLGLAPDDREVDL